MRLPKLRVLNSGRQVVDSFRGYNHNLRIGDGEFYDMRNMTSDHYPVLSTRPKRGLLGDVVKPSGLLSKGELCRVEGGAFFIGGEEAAEMELSDEPKKMVSMGAYVIILPDKKWVNTAPNSKGEYEWGDIEMEYYSSTPEGSHRIKVSTCDIEGKKYASISTAEQPPEDPKNGDLWMDISDQPVSVKQYYSGSKSWGVIKSYVKIASPGIANGFAVGDGVVISGMPFKSFNGTKILRGVAEDGNYILIDGAFYDPDYQDDGYNRDLSVVRKMPDLDFIIEHNNRLWGCKYGETKDGKFVNEIYASKLGDFKNWNCFDGISTDSYVASCGSDGPFTGAITHGGHPIFFKENGLHKVYGDFPSSFQVQYVPMPGVQEGCGKSLAAVGSTLFYKSRNGVCAYDGSIPVEISAAFGNKRYHNAVAGAHGNKYYISMQEDNEDGTPHLFVFDTEKGLWHREDSIRVNSFCSHMNYLYAIESKTGNVIILSGADFAEIDEDEVSWSVETGVWGLNTVDMKYISRILIRMALEEGARVDVSIQYDSSDSWEQVCVMSATSLRSFCIPVRPRRCDHFRLRISGAGGCKIYSITKTIEQGSDIS